MSAHYPEALHNPKILKNLSEDYCGALKFWGEDQLSEACRIHLRTGRFFPKISDLLAILDSLPAKKKEGVLQIDEGGSYKSEFDREKSKLFAGVMGMLRRKELTEEQALGYFKKVGSGELKDLKDISSNP